MALPSIQFEGRIVGGDPELRFTPTGHAVIKLRLMCTHKKKDGEDGDPTFLDVQAWRNVAENLAETVTRNDLVVGFGALKQRDWEDNNGQKRTNYFVEAYSIGPSIRYASAALNRVQRDQPAPAGQDPWTAPQGGQQGAQADPWAAPPEDTPPF